jgi:hypothetical protein
MDNHVEKEKPAAKTMVITIMAKAPLDASIETMQKEVNSAITFMKTGGLFEPIAYLIKEKSK